MAEFGEAANQARDSVLGMMIAVVGLIVVLAMTGAEQSMNLPPQAQNTLALTTTSFLFAISEIISTPDVRTFLLALGIVGACGIGAYTLLRIVDERESQSASEAI